ncbi:hypothetical protein F4802DRAFT_527588 [Xylaria palmicola]|nr:hypothetical protein F4802DRAFT_527588 [Xylaria palmicola]
MIPICSQDDQYMGCVSVVISYAIDALEMTTLLLWYSLPNQSADLGSLVREDGMFYVRLARLGSYSVCQASDNDADDDIVEATRINWLLGRRKTEDGGQDKIRPNAGRHLPTYVGRLVASNTSQALPMASLWGYRNVSMLLLCTRPSRRLAAPSPPWRIVITACSGRPRLNAMTNAGSLYVSRVSPHNLPPKGRLWWWWSVKVEAIQVARHRQQSNYRDCTYSWFLYRCSSSGCVRQVRMMERARCFEMYGLRGT